MPKYKNPRKTWAYSTEFKIRAVKLSRDPDYKISDVAEGLGIHPFMLSRWRKEYQDGILHGDGKLRIGMAKKKKSPPRKMTELAALKKKVARLEQENDLLKSGNSIWRKYIRTIWIHPQIQRLLRSECTMRLVGGLAQWLLRLE